MDDLEAKDEVDGTRRQGGACQSQGAEAGQI